MVHICLIICCAVISYFDLILVILISFCRLLRSGYICYMYFAGVAFSALTLLVGWQEKTEWWGTGVVICLERGADLHMAQMMPLPLTVSCFSKIQIGFTFLVPAQLGSPGKRAVKRVCVCVCAYTDAHALACVYFTGLCKCKSFAAAPCVFLQCLCLY